MLPMTSLPTRVQDLRVLEFAAGTTVAITPDRAEMLNIYAIQDGDGATNTFYVTYTSKGGSMTGRVLTQSTASALPVACTSMPPLRPGDTMTITGTVSTRYRIFAQAFPA